MAFSVRVRQIAAPFSAAPGQTILDAAFAAGHDYPCGCQSGNCGACKSHLLAGEVEMSPYSDYALTAEERAAGQILACRAVPWSDVEVAWLESDEVASHAQRRLACRVLSIEPLTHDISRLRLAIESGGPFTFSAGQYASLAFDGLPPRDYSMASQPDEADLEFHIRTLPGGAVSAHVRERLRPGDVVRVEGPRGISFLREKHAGPILAFAGGSGLAPVKSIVERALRLGARQPIHLYFGVRDERDLYLESHFRALEGRHGNFRFTVVLSEPSGETARRTGFLADIIRSDIGEVDGARAYLAGPPVMVETCVAALAGLGLGRERCHADAFYTEAERTGAGR
ncbi:MAG: 2Fe-2S iron-sulfur cluster binding domain-containing protein [Alphaproteobacteria bacterium]|nr:2Fe-2S iron-sulfur cluster binding domain-containing protein [Alphaproteobacteria bacterium]